MFSPARVTSADKAKDHGDEPSTEMHKGMLRVRGCVITWSVMLIARLRAVEGRPT